MYEKHNILLINAMFQDIIEIEIEHRRTKHRRAKHGSNNDL